MPYISHNEPTWKIFISSLFMHRSAKTQIFFHDDITCLWTWIFVSFSQLSVQKSTTMMKNFLVLFWNWASSDSDQQQVKRWSSFANTIPRYTAWFAEKSAVKSDIPQERNHKLVSVGKYLICIKCLSIFDVRWSSWKRNKLNYKVRAKN